MAMPTPLNSGHYVPNGGKKPVSTPPGTLVIYDAGPSRSGIRRQKDRRWNRRQERRMVVLGWDKVSV
jgi:hypothetical protein